MMESWRLCEIIAISGKGNLGGILAPVSPVASVASVALTALTLTIEREKANRDSRWTSGTRWTVRGRSFRGRSEESRVEVEKREKSWRGNRIYFDWRDGGCMGDDKFSKKVSHRGI